MSLPPESPQSEERPFEQEPIRLPEGPAAFPSPRARRRRRSSILVQPDLNQHATLLENLARRAYPSYEFFLYSALCGAVLGLGYLIDAQALLVFGALLAPLLTPWVGMALSAVTGSGRYFFQSLAGFLVGSLLVFVSGAIAGFAARIFMPLPFAQSFYHSRLWWPDLLVLVAGSILLAISFVRSEEKPVLPSVMLAYELYLPLSAAAFGLGAGLPALWPDGMLVFLVHLSLATILGVIALVIMGFRPATFAGYTFGTTIALLVLVTLVGVSGVGTAIRNRLAFPGPVPVVSASATPSTEAATAVPSPSPSATVPAAPSAARPSATPSPVRTPARTSTLVFPTTAVPTATITPQPTPVYARVYSEKFGGALVRSEPDGTAITTIQNGILVQVLPEVEYYNGAVWVKIIAIIGPSTIEGWVIQSLLVTATPAANWAPTATPTATVSITP